MHAHRLGDHGPLVVLLHGIPGSSADWLPVAERLAHDHRVLACDLLGFGASPRPATIDGLWADAQAAALEPLIDEPAIVVGHDFGGPTALTLYTRRPELFARLVLLATNAFGDTPIPMPIRAVTWPVVGGFAEHALMSGPALRMIARGRADVGDGDQVRATRLIFAAALRELEPRYAPIEQTLPKIAVPTTVLWGDRDEFFSLDDGKRLAAAIPGAHLQILEGAGHFLACERTDDVVAAIAG